MLFPIGRQYQTEDGVAVGYAQGRRFSRQRRLGADLARGRIPFGPPLPAVRALLDEANEIAGDETGGGGIETFSAGAPERRHRLPGIGAVDGQGISPAIRWSARVAGRPSGGADQEHLAIGRKIHEVGIVSSVRANHADRAGFAGEYVKASQQQDQETVPPEHLTSTVTRVTGRELLLPAASEGVINLDDSEPFLRLSLGELSSVSNRSVSLRSTST